MLLSQIAQIVGGKLLGDGNFKVETIKSLSAADASSLSFYSDHKQREQLEHSRAGAVLLAPDSIDCFPGDKIVVHDPYLAYARISRYFSPDRVSRQAVSRTAIIAEDARLGAGVRVGDYSVIAEGAEIRPDVVLGNHVSIGPQVVVGEGTQIDDHVVVYARSRIGRHCCISSGAVIGAPGFGYAPEGHKWQKITHLGSVDIGDQVDIGANTTIDRGSLDDTVIGNRVKLDNQIHIAHNVQVGEDTVMAGCVAIAGSTRIGRRCKLGGRSSVLGHLTIADEVTIYAESLVTSSIHQPGGEYASMVPVQPIRVWRKTVAHLHRLDNLVNKVRAFGNKQL